ncbi:MAG: FKBP-type peptidyl-prolyl cis-trans isomerase [Bacteroidetes bacterium]|nr:FKBP-type peptidyl-prolyl cis-trans isomerase [Bacteroidota bacterium]
MNDELDSISYLLGAAIASNILKDIPDVNTDLNKELIIQGLRDKIYGNTPSISDPTNQILGNWFQQRAEREAQAAMQEGIRFLEENKKNPNVKVTASGLQYEVIKQGTGAKPTATSKVKVHYHGTTPSGEVFDSSVQRGEPITFGLNQVISGWTEGLQLMAVGSKYRLFIPQELAYGANPQPGSAIKPYMPLVFEVELLGIEN